MTWERIPEWWKQYNYEFETWAQDPHFRPIARVASIDLSEPYEQDKATVFKNSNGELILVKECGCSCYEPSWAEISYFKSKADLLTHCDNSQDTLLESLRRKILEGACHE